MIGCRLEIRLRLRRYKRFRSNSIDRERGMAVGALEDFEEIFEGVERRRHTRLRVVLGGRCMLQDRREFTCRVIDLSLGGLAVAVPAVARIGERVVAYLDEIGRFEGRVARLVEGGFAMVLDLTLHGRDKLVQFLSRRGGERAVGERRHERRLVGDFVSRMVVADGSAVDCRVLDLSVSGAAVAFLGPRPAVGSRVRLGTTVGRVARQFDRGVAIAFEEASVSGGVAAQDLFRLGDPIRREPPVARASAMPKRS
jgi:hypothetical protein